MTKQDGSGESSKPSSQALRRGIDDDLVFLERPRLPFTRGTVVGELPGSGVFAKRNPLNVPGQFYAAETDTCGGGPIEAPNNVACDANGHEFIFRQPRNEQELRDVFAAAAVEPRDGWAFDGNQHWTPALVRAWWVDRARVVEAWRAAGVPTVETMIENEVQRWLRAYLFFLTHGRPPEPSESLPSLRQPSAH